MIDFHTHSLLSDGVLLPSELVRRYEVSGFKAVAITDHADSSNIDFIISSLVKVSLEINKYWKIYVMPGIELTHIPLEQFSPLAKHARRAGAKIIVAHGETTVEPVLKGTNRAAIEAGVDIIAHPGLITSSDAKEAARRNIFLEITTRRGHCLTNRHVAKMAKNACANLIFDSDSHIPENIPTKALFEKTAKDAGLSKADTKKAFLNSETLLKRIIRLT